MKPQKPESKSSIWGPELLLVVVLPFIVIAAIVVTVMIASDNRFTPDKDVQTDRFARPLEPSS